MGRGYLSNISFYVDPVSTAVADLESQLVAGAKSQEILEPLINELASRIERYNTGIKQVKGVYATLVDLS